MKILVPANVIIHKQKVKLYESRGFSATGVEDEDEIELVMTLE